MRGKHGTGAVIIPSYFTKTKNGTALRCGAVPGVAECRYSAEMEATPLPMVFWISDQTWRIRVTSL